MPTRNGSEVVSGFVNLSEPLPPSPPWLSSGSALVLTLACVTSEKAMAVEETTANMANAIMSLETDRRFSRKLAVRTRRADETDEGSLSLLLPLLELLSVLLLCGPSDDSWRASTSEVLRGVFVDKLDAEGFCDAWDDAAADHVLELAGDRNAYSRDGDSSPT